MYCPGCGSEERQISQFCRACGTDLRVVRASLERPDAITESAVTAREQIGLAVAEKIREFDDSRDLKRVAEDVLPQIEKFLESPEERRLRRLRAGVITAVIGVGASLLALLVIAAVSDLPGKEPETIPLLAFVVGLGVITFLIGLGVLLNGLVFTRPRKALQDNSSDAQAQNLLDGVAATPQLRPAVERPELFHSPTTSDLAHAERPAGSSVTEHTTHHLKSDR